MKRLIALFSALTMIVYGGIIMTACTGNGAVSGGESAADEASAAKQKEGTLKADYYYAAGTTCENDASRTLLKGGAEAAVIKAGGDIPETITANDWSDAPHTLEMPDAEAAVVFDFGFISRIEKIELGFAEEFSGYTDVFASTDGYNFSFYRGTAADAKDFEAKAVMLRFGGFESEIKLRGVDFYGKPAAEKMLLSKGASYVFEGTGLKRYTDGEGVKLTDGKTFADAGEEAVAGKLTPSERDPVNGRTCGTLVIDLGEAKNVSEVAFDLFAEKGKDAPEPVQIRYSENGSDYSDFGQARALCGAKYDELNGFTYKMTRAFTVKARYIKLWVPGALPIITDEISVYGADSAVAEPEYTAPDERYSFTVRKMRSRSRNTPRRTTVIRLPTRRHTKRRLPETRNTRSLPTDVLKNPFLSERE